MIHDWISLNIILFMGDLRCLWALEWALTDRINRHCIHGVNQPWMGRINDPYHWWFQSKRGISNELISMNTLVPADGLLMFSNNPFPSFSHNCLEDLSPKNLGALETMTAWSTSRLMESSWLISVSKFQQPAFPTGSATFCMKLAGDQAGWMDLPASNWRTMNSSPPPPASVLIFFHWGEELGATATLRTCREMGLATEFQARGEHMSPWLSIRSSDYSLSG